MIYVQIWFVYKSICFYLLLYLLILSHLLSSNLLSFVHYFHYLYLRTWLISKNDHIRFIIIHCSFLIMIIRCLNIHFFNGYQLLWMSCSYLLNLVVVDEPYGTNLLHGVFVSKDEVDFIGLADLRYGFL